MFAVHAHVLPVENDTFEHLSHLRIIINITSQKTNTQQRPPLFRLQLQLVNKNSSFATTTRTRDDGGRSRHLDLSHYLAISRSLAANVMFLLSFVVVVWSEVESVVCTCSCI